MKYQVGIYNAYLNKHEYIGLDYDKETLKLLHDKQEKQMLMLDKEAREYVARVKQKDAKVESIRSRQRAMSKTNVQIIW